MSGGTIVAVVACILTVVVNLIIVAYYAGKMSSEVVQLKKEVAILRASLHDLRNAMLAFMLGGTVNLPEDMNGTSLTQMVTQFVLNKPKQSQKSAAAASTMG